MIVATFAIGNRFVARERAVTADILGHDFLAFYTAGAFARAGKFEQLYNLDAVQHAQRQIAVKSGLATGASYGPFWNPPFYAWVFAPLAMLPFHAALVVWITINLAALAVAIVLIVRMLPEPHDWQTWVLVPLLLCMSMPFIQAITHAQNTFVSLLLLALVVTAWRARYDVTAGLLCGLLFYKPQLGVVVAAVLVMTRGLRVCLGLAFVLGSLLLITATTMPNALGDYLARLPANVRFIQDQQTYLWERHVTLKALFRLLFQGRGAGDATLAVQILTVTCATVAGIGLLIGVMNVRHSGADDCWTGETRSRRRDRLIAATICAMPLVMPFYFDYDLLLLAIPAVLFAGEIASRPLGAQLSSSDRWMVAAWCALDLWLLVNPPVAELTGVNLAVVLLAVVAGMQIIRACEQTPDSAWGRETMEVIKVTARRAA